MFSGIVEEKGVVRRIVRKKNLLTLTIAAQKTLKRTKTGDSIAVEGVCLTVTKKSRDSFCFDLMKETIARTTLGFCAEGYRVNLERALKAGAPLGGHFVQGHVDGIGMIRKKITRRHYCEYRIEPPRDLLVQLVTKGSVSVDGISLTVGDIGRKEFSVYIIPHTLSVTTLGYKEKGDRVNIETDLIAKHILRLAQMGLLNVKKKR